jgi:hypothetical protein
MRATAWLRVALLAGLAGALVALAFDLLVAERVLDRAIALETQDHALGVPEPFSRAGQRGGLVAGELMLGLGFGLVLAGALTILTPIVASNRRLWLLGCGAAAWAVVVLPNLVYPPLPPGVETGLPIGERQLLWLGLVAIGLASFVCASFAVGRGRRLVAAASLGVPAILALVLLPADGAVVGDGVQLDDFRVVAIASQVLLWTTLAVTGAWQLRRRSAPALHPRAEAAS